MSSELPIADPGYPIDAGVARYVSVLRDAGVETYESCEGGPGHCAPEPTVWFHGTRAGGWRALCAALDVDLPVLELRRVWPINDGEPTGPCWAIVFRRKDQPVTG